MSPLPRCGLGAFLLLVSACTTIRVEPNVSLASVRGLQRPSLDFELHRTGGSWLVSTPLDRRSAEGLDGEDLAQATVPFRAALLATEAFAGVARAAAGRRLHCDVQMYRGGSTYAGGMFLGLSLGLIPDLGNQECEIVALVTAPGREPRTYRASGNASTWLWLPLVPVGIVQCASQRSVLQQTVDAIVAQMAQDGWL